MSAESAVSPGKCHSASARVEPQQSGGKMGPEAHPDGSPLAGVQVDELLRLIRSGSLTAQALEWCARHAAPSVRLEVARSPLTDEGTLQELADDVETSVAGMALRALGARATHEHIAERTGDGYVPEGTTHVTCGASCTESKVRYELRAWPSGVAIEFGTALTQDQLSRVLRQEWKAPGSETWLPVALVLVRALPTRAPAQAWFAPVRCMRVYLPGQQSAEGSMWALSTLVPATPERPIGLISVEVQPPSSRSIEAQLAQLAHVVLEREAAVAAEAARPPQPFVISKEAFLASLSPASPPPTSDEGAKIDTEPAAAPEKPSARALEQQQRYRELLRETLIVEAFKVLLPRSVDHDIDDLGPAHLAHDAMQFVDALMAKAFKEREVAGD